MMLIKQEIQKLQWEEGPDGQLLDDIHCHECYFTCDNAPATIWGMLTTDLSGKHGPHSPADKQVH